MPKAKRSIVVHNPMQIVLRRDFRVWIERICLTNVLSHVQVAYREVNQCLQLAPLVSNLSEAFKLNDEDRRKLVDLEALGVGFVRLAVDAVHVVFEQLAAVELNQGFVERGVVMRLVKADLSLENTAVLDDIVGGLVVELCQDGPVPLDREERVVDQILDEDRGVVGFDDAAATLLSPVALGARVALSIDRL